MLITQSFTAEDKHRAIVREIGMRKHVYPDLVAAGRMTQATADRQIAVMQAIAADYARELEKERLL
jgi:hypothetical protein